MPLNVQQMNWQLWQRLERKPLLSLTVQYLPMFKFNSYLCTVCSTRHLIWHVSRTRVISLFCLSQISVWLIKILYSVVYHCQFIKNHVRKRKPTMAGLSRISHSYSHVLNQVPCTVYMLYSCQIVIHYILSMYERVKMSVIPSSYINNILIHLMKSVSFSRDTPSWVSYFIVSLTLRYFLLYYVTYFPSIYLNFHHVAISVYCEVACRTDKIAHQAF